MRAPSREKQTFGQNSPLRLPSGVPMPGTLAHDSTITLEHSSKRPGAHSRVPVADFRAGEGSEGLERIEVYIPKLGFSMHRHDTYAIGITLSGVQAFSYRGMQRYCLPGECHILHPDEAHDGSSAVEGGFRYRIAYIDPFLVQRAIGGKPLPFVETPVVKLTPDQEQLLSSAWDMSDRVDALRQVEIVSAVAEVLEALAVPRGRKREALCFDALLRVHELLAAVPASRHALEELEKVAGLDRWTLARQFRAAFGTSPTRFRTMRQLDRVRLLLRRGISLIEAAQEAGFADQCHMSRLFKQAYGLSPGRWVTSLSP
jgi:AraC-like DNA-binding protein